MDIGNLSLFSDKKSKNTTSPNKSRTFDNKQQQQQGEQHSNDAWAGFGDYDSSTTNSNNNIPNKAVASPAVEEDDENYEQAKIPRHSKKQDEKDSREEADAAASLASQAALRQQHRSC